MSIPACPAGSLQGIRRLVSLVLRAATISLGPMLLARQGRSLSLGKGVSSQSGKLSAFALPSAAISNVIREPPSLVAQPFLAVPLGISYPRNLCALCCSALSSLLFPSPTQISS